MHRLSIIVIVITFIIVFWDVVLFSICDITTPTIPIKCDNRLMDNASNEFIGSCSIPYKNKNMLFIGDSCNNSTDAIYVHDNKKMTLWQTIDKRENENTTAACTIILNKKMTLLVARNNKLFKYSRNANDIFVGLDEPFYAGKIGSIITNISVTNFDKSDKLSIYLSFMNHETSDIEIPNALLVYNEDTKTWDDMAVDYGIIGKGNTTAAVFVDLTNSGYPDLVEATHDGDIRIYKNNEGTFTQTMVEQMPKGAWRGLVVGDFDNTGRQSVYISNDQTLHSTNVDKIIERRHCILYNLGDYNFKIHMGCDINSSGIIKRKIGPGRGVTSTDITHSGRSDILMAQKFPSRGTTLIRRRNKFARTYKFSNPHIGCSVITSDLTGNGNKEIVWINATTVPVIYKNVLTRANNAVRVHIPSNAVMANVTAKAYYKNGKVLSIQNVIGGGSGPNQSSCLVFGTRLSGIHKIDIFKNAQSIMQTIDSPENGSDYHL